MADSDLVTTLMKEMSQPLQGDVQQGGWQQPQGQVVPVHPEQQLQILEDYKRQQEQQQPVQQAPLAGQPQHPADETESEEESEGEEEEGVKTTESSKKGFISTLINSAILFLVVALLTVAVSTGLLDAFVSPLVGGNATYILAIRGFIVGLGAFIFSLLWTE
jgi:uncharacterized membrane protein